MLIQNEKVNGKIGAVVNAHKTSCAADMDMRAWILNQSHSISPPIFLIILHYSVSVITLLVLLIDSI